jgi:mono/diheme cytochrome c family protein
MGALALSIGLGIAATACGAPEETAKTGAGPAAPTAPAAPSAQPAAPRGVDPAVATAKAQEIFSTRCVTCHGSEGHGDGPASAGLTPPPRNFSDGAWQDSVQDDYIAKIVSYGGAAVGKSPAMPGNPDLITQREVLTALVAKVRSLRAH